MTKSFAALLSCSLALLLAMPCAAATDYSLGLSAARRVDQFDWNIGGYNFSGTYVNVLSELTWSDLEVRELALNFAAVSRADTPQPFYSSVLRVSIARGWIVDGDNRDSDYNGNNRTNEFSRSVSDAGDGRTFDAGIGAALLFDLGATLQLGPAVGYAWSRQELTMTDGVQVIPDLGPFPGLDSSYDADWHGPWLGAEGHWRPALRWHLQAGIKLHFLDYEAEANWNLRGDFQHPKSFEHYGDGYGIDVGLAVDYALWRRLALNVAARFSSWRIEDGRDLTYFASGSVAETDLNEVNRESVSLALGLTGRF